MLRGRNCWETPLKRAARPLPCRQSHCSSGLSVPPFTRTLGQGHLSMPMASSYLGGGEAGWILGEEGGPDSSLGTSSTQLGNRQVCLLQAGP